MHEFAARKISSPLVSGHQLLKGLFDESSRPSIRWLRYQMAARTVPFLKVGRLVFFDIEAVREVLASRFTVRSQSRKSSKARGLALVRDIPGESPAQ